MTSHKNLMAGVIALAVIHMVLSAAVGVLVSQNNLKPQHMIAFCGVSVVVNLIIVVLAGMCHSKKDCKD